MFHSAYAKDKRLPGKVVLIGFISTPCKDFKQQIKDGGTAHNKPKGHNGNKTVAYAESRRDNRHEFTQRSSLKSFQLLIASRKGEIMFTNQNVIIY